MLRLHVCATIPGSSSHLMASFYIDIYWILGWWRSFWRDWLFHCTLVLFHAISHNLNSVLHLLFNRQSVCSFGFLLNFFFVIDLLWLEHHIPKRSIWFCFSDMSSALCVCVCVRAHAHACTYVHAYIFGSVVSHLMLIWGNFNHCSFCSLISPMMYEQHLLLNNS